jgi:hypothetical protein
MFNIIGIVGMLLFLAAYYLLQQDALSAHDPRYLWMNFTGSIAVLASLLWAWNLPSFLLESAWAIISAYGLIRLRRKA